MQSIKSSITKIIILLNLIVLSMNSSAGELIAIPNSKIAEEVATIVLSSIYGKEISKQKPFVITEREGYWFIDGQIPKKSKGVVVVGGIVHCEIRKSDGAFRNIIHGK